MRIIILVKIALFLGLLFFLSCSIEGKRERIDVQRGQFLQTLRVQDKGVVVLSDSVKWLIYTQDTITESNGTIKVRHTRQEVRREQETRQTTHKERTDTIKAKAEVSELIKEKTHKSTQTDIKKGVVLFVFSLSLCCVLGLIVKCVKWLK